MEVPEDILEFLAEGLVLYMGAPDTPEGDEVFLAFTHKELGLITLGLDVLMCNPLLGPLTGGVMKPLREKMSECLKEQWDL